MSTQPSVSVADAESAVPADVLDVAPRAPEAVEVAVVGAGAIGLAIAWRLSQAGVNVALIDPRPGLGASWAAAAMLAPITEAHYGDEPLVPLNLASYRRWPDFAAELEAATGRASGFRATGTLVVARDGDEAEALDDLYDFQRSLDLDVQRLGSGATRELEPGLVPGVRGGLRTADHQVDNRQMLIALAAACAATGVPTVTQRVDRLLTDDGGAVDGVRLDSGERIAAATVVVAAGAWSAHIGGVPDAAVPVRPVKGELVHLRAPNTGPLAGVEQPPLASRNVRTVIGRPGRPPVYVVPRGDGRVIVGATADERGFDTQVTAGGVLDLLREAYRLLPAVTDYELTATVAGLRPGSPDNGPLLGPGPLDGMVVATGHFRNGILLTPITADAIAHCVLDGRLPEVAAGFSVHRFEPSSTAGRSGPSPDPRSPTPAVSADLDTH